MHSSFEQELQTHGKLVYRNRGTSMLPMLRQNRDLVVIEPIGEKTIERYDVVFYRYGDKYFLHRVIKVLPNGFVICGDHNRKQDPVVLQEQILGILTSFIRNGREITVQSLSYRFYSRIWANGIIPARILIYKAARILIKR